MIAAMMQVILAIFIFAGGIIKLLRVPFQVEHWQHYQYPLWFMSVTGVLELNGGIAMLVGLKNRYWTVGAGVLLIFLLLGAIHAHLVRANQPFATAIPALICLILSVVLIVRNLKAFI